MRPTDDQIAREQASDAYEEAVAVHEEAAAASEKEYGVTGDNVPVENAETGEVKNLSDLPIEDQVGAIAQVVAQVIERLTILEGSLVRILIKAGEIEDPESGIVVPKMMAVPKARGPRGRRR